MKNRPTPLTDAFIQRLKDDMKNHQIKKTTLGRAIGTNKTTIQRWTMLPRTRTPTSEFLLKIMAFMKETMKLF